MLFQGHVENFGRFLGSLSSLVSSWPFPYELPAWNTGALATKMILWPNEISLRFVNARDAFVVDNCRWPSVFHPESRLPLSGKGWTLGGHNTSAIEASTWIFVRSDDFQR